jgi:hypothetical protein
MGGQGRVEQPVPGKGPGGQAQVDPGCCAVQRDGHARLGDRDTALGRCSRPGIGSGGDPFQQLPDVAPVDELDVPRGSEQGRDDKQEGVEQVVLGCRVPPDRDLDFIVGPLDRCEPGGRLREGHGCDLAEQVAGLS